MDLIDVLMPAQMLPLVIEGLESDFRLHKLWEAADREAFLGEIGPRIKAIASGPDVNRSRGAHARLGAEMLGRFPDLAIVASFGVGYDHIDVRWAAEHGIVVTNTPDVLTEEVADTALGLLLATVRRLPQADRFVREGKWDEENFPLSPSLRGRTLGILGLGRIGKAIARRAASFGLKIAYHSRSAQEDVPYLYYPTLLGMARAVDILMVITPGGEATRHLVNAEVLEALGGNGILINVARGSVVDEAALIAALRDRKILAAGLDVFAHEPDVPPELIARDDVVLLPHVGSASQHARDAMGQMVVDNLKSWATGRGPISPVPETPWPAAAKSAHSAGGG